LSDELFSFEAVESQRKILGWHELVWADFESTKKYYSGRQWGVFDRKEGKSV